jgi:hypothetical protein
MANLWEAAPLADQQQATGGNQWEQAPIVQPAVPEGYGLTDSMMGGLPGGDEAGALGGALGQFLRGGGWDYSGQLEKQRGARKAYGEANPATQVAGDVVAGMAMAPARGVALATTLGGSVAQGAKQGAVAGGLYGVADEGDIGQRLGSGALGAGFGAGLGAAVPVAFEGARQIASRPLSAIRGYRDPEGFAMGKATQALERGGQTAPDIQAGLDAARMGGAPSTTLADVGGRSAQRMVRATTNIPGRAGDAVGEFLDARQMDAQHRVASKLQQHWAGATGNVVDEAERLTQHARATAGPIYERAYAEAPAVDTSGVVRYIDSVISPGATGMAQPRSDLRPDTISGELARVRQWFETNRNQRVGLNELHRVKMDLDGMIERARRDSGSKGTLTRELTNVQRRLLEAMDQASPSYRQARNIFSGDMRMRDALESGREFFKEDPEVIRNMVRRMNPAELAQYKDGAFRAIRDKLGTDDMASVYDKLFKGQVVRDKLRAVFGNDAAFNDFQRFMLNERLLTGTRRAAQGNSTTVQQGHDVNDAGMDAAAAVQFGQQVASGNVVGATISAIGRVVSKLGGWNEESAAATARLLLSADPAVQAQVLAQLGQQRTNAGTGVLPLIQRFMAIEGAAGAGRGLN